MFGLGLKAKIFGLGLGLGLAARGLGVGLSFATQNLSIRLSLLHAPAIMTTSFDSATSISDKSGTFWQAEYIFSSFLALFIKKFATFLFQVYLA